MVDTRCGRMLVPVCAQLRHGVLAALLGCAALGGTSLAGCGSDVGVDESPGSAQDGVWRDEDDWADDARAHPQVIHMGSGPGCTGWLSSSNTVTFNAHCLKSTSPADIGWTYNSAVQRNSSDAQFAALKNMGSPIAAYVHPFGVGCMNKGPDCCIGADIAVLVFNPANAVPRNVLRPLAIKAATSDEPECDGADTCLMMVGTGRTFKDECEDDGSFDGHLDPGATQLFLESGLGDGDCEENDDMLYGEYDYDDSQICKGDSGSPIFWRETDEVMAVNRGWGREIGLDDVVGPILWKGGPNTARDFFLEMAGNQDHDQHQAAFDNCDRDWNDDQKDFNGNQIGDVCDDSDGDGIFDANELAAGTDPTKSDTDGDGLSDGAEKTKGTDPKDPDSDDDGLNDGEEVNTHHTDPLDADSDDDNLTDGEEVLTYHTNPLDTDSDDDELTDGAEVDVYGTNPTDPDTDDDLVTDGQEVLFWGTDPLDADTDDDLLTDGFELTHGTDPLDADSDDDGLIDGRDPDWISTATDALPDSAFKAPGHREAIGAHFNQVEHFAQRAIFDQARLHLGHLRFHLDGCGADPDLDDWLVVCDSQVDIRDLVDVLDSNL